MGSGDMSNVNSKMTALADEVRELSGSSAKMGIDDMTTNVSIANEEVDNQTDLIAQIKAVVDNLPEAGGNIPAFPNAEEVEF
jgi:hypothetical protein